MHRTTMLPVLAAAALATAAPATGTWQAIATQAPNSNSGVMLLLSDGTVICKTNAGGTDGYGNTWNRLTPNAAGSYSSGTWSSIAPMINTRLYFSSQVLRDGRVYVAGGEYGTGLQQAEVWNPLTNAWTACPSPGANISDANSELLPDGRVLQAIVAGTLKTTRIYDPATNTFGTGPTCLGIHNESAWVKMSDSSIMMVDRHAVTAERYVPASGAWVKTADCPVALYDDYGYETGGALLLPDGKAMFFGSNGHNAAYSLPSASAPLGSWTVLADFPGTRGTPDAPESMLPNGKVLCIASPIPTSANHFPTPSTFFEYDPATNAFTQLVAPGGAASVNTGTYVWTFLNLPDGSILCCQQGSRQYWRYVPDGAPQDAWRPAVSSAVRAPATGQWTIGGTQLNGISQGSTYGDDWQMNTNYPVVRLVNAAGTATTYCRTFNWSSTGVQTGSLPVTTQMTIPATVAPGTYSLVVTANGIASFPRTIFNPKPNCTADLNLDGLVDGADMAILLSAWGTAGNSVTGGGDLDGSGTVDGSDLGLLLAAWGTCPP